MKKAYLTGIREMTLRDVPDPPAPLQGEVRIRLTTIGVCGSDIHYFREGRIGAQVVEFPFAVGHECAGVIDQLGPGVEGLSPGQRVAVDPLVTCGQCDQCRNGRENTCRNQRFLGCPGQIEGAMSEFIVLPARCAFAIPDSMSFDQAVMVEPFAIGLWAQKLAGEMAGKTAAILGAGPIGLCTLQAVKASGDCDVCVTDLLDYRVEKARATGADWAANAAGTDVVSEILRRHPDGVDFVFEAAGQQDTVDQAGQVLTPGGKMLLIGIPDGNRLSFDMNDWRRRELGVQNVRRQNGCTDEAIAIVAEGKVQLDPQVTHHFPLAESQAAFDLVADYADGAVNAVVNVEAD